MSSANSDSNDGTSDGTPSIPAPPIPCPVPSCPTTLLNCLLVGDPSAKKTDLLHAYLEQHFPGHHVPCAFFEHTINCSVHGLPVTLKIWDLTGQECYDKLRQLAYKQIGFDVSLVCFSIVDPDSLESVKSLWLPEIKWNCPKRPFFLVGTEFDLRTDKSTFEQLQFEGKMPVTRSAGIKVAKQFGARKYFECSAARKQGLKELFDDAILAGLKQKQLDRNGRKQKKGEENCSIQ